MPLFPKFYPDPNGPFKINERKLRPGSSSSQSSSSHSSTSIRAPPTRLEAHVPVVEVVPAMPVAFSTEVRTPRSNLVRAQHIIVSQRQPPRNSPSPDHTFAAAPAPRPSFPPSPASVKSDSALFVPPHAPDPPPAAHPPPYTPQTTLRMPPSRIPTELRSDPGSQRSSSSQGGSRKAHSDRGHGRKHSISTSSTSDSSSSRQSDAQTAPTTVSGQSGGRKDIPLLKAAPKNTRRVRIAEEQIEFADPEGRQRINRYRYA